MAQPFAPFSEVLVTSELKSPFCLSRRAERREQGTLWVRSERKPVPSPAMKSLILITFIILAQQPAKAPEGKGIPKGRSSKVGEQADEAKNDNQTATDRAPLPNQTFIYDEQSATPHPQENERQSDHDTRIQGRIKTFTGMLVGVGFLQLVVMALQWWLIRRQTLFFRNSERAWILADTGEIPDFRPDPAKLNSSGSGQQSGTTGRPLPV